MWRLFQWFKPNTADPAKPARRKGGLLNPVGTDPADEELTRSALIHLESHLFCWLLNASPAELARDTPQAPMVLTRLQSELDDDNLTELPRQPAVLPMLMRALSAEDTSRHQLAEIILGDPSLTEQLLHVANSPFFRPSDQPIESVEHAIFLLGLDGVRSVAAAAVMRPMMTARSNHEALFTQRVWRWGLACARAAELIARSRGADGNAFFLVSLVPALAYITLRREVARIYRALDQASLPEASVIRTALRTHEWDVARLLSARWDLPPQYQAYLMTAERPPPRGPHTPINDGIILGTREVLRHAHQRNLPEEQLLRALQLDEPTFVKIRTALLGMLREAPHP
ncbi:HDOD domain-containing protein [Marinobacter halodurans]|uniref:HDOD domain-containing protein n=1 Tax=Marinobacter halodurans TaxID=2528979 RepID=A0ABY1ZI91_9GAMM|nr:HDOD domain-containing protein [Marinobacter halodurans]TBW50753.1 HDOD domain-containing protein [Marinobacter halodurans]